MRLLLFDVDGTLLQAHGAGRRALEHALRTHYGLTGDLDRIAMDGKTDPLILRELLELEGLDFEGMTGEFVQTYVSRLEQELESCPEFLVLKGVLELIPRLQGRPNLLLGLATGNVQEGARLKVRRAGLAHFFRFGGFGCDAEDRTEVVRAAMRRGQSLTAQPVREAIVIGDTPRDIEHGHRAGAKVLAVATGSYDLDTLRGHRPDRAVASLEPSAELVEFLTNSYY